MVFIIIIAILFAVILMTAYVCFRITFHVTKKQKNHHDEYPIPAGKTFEPWHDKMINWIKETRALPCQEYSIKSFDGLTLYGKFYEYTPGAIIELMIHGYRGNAERDLCGGVQRCFTLGHSAFVIDQRACGKSDGRVISFGIRERRDCQRWIDHLIQTFGPDVKIILTGISMGAATVLMTAGQPLPKNVIGVLADCGYTSAKDIIKVVIRKINLPPNLAYPFVKLGAFLFGGFRLEKESAISAISKCKVPVVFYHGEADNFVPCYMSKQNYDACTSKKQLVTIPDAGHGLCYLVDPEKYLSTLDSFFPEESSTAQNSNA